MGELSKIEIEKEIPTIDFRRPAVCKGWVQLLKEQSEQMKEDLWEDAEDAEIVKTDEMKNRNEINSENLKAAGIPSGPGYRHGRYDTDVFKAGPVKIELDYLHHNPTPAIPPKQIGFSILIGDIEFPGVKNMQSLMRLFSMLGHRIKKPIPVNLHNKEIEITGCPNGLRREFEDYSWTPQLEAFNAEEE